MKKIIFLFVILALLFIPCNIFADDGIDNAVFKATKKVVGIGITVFVVSMIAGYFINGGK
jgi:hypothetical protein